MWKAFVAVLASVVLSGCASLLEPESYGVSVAAVSAGGFDPARRHKVVYEGAEALNDPVLQGVIDPTRRMLAAAGLTLTAAPDEPADVVVTVAYVEEPAKSYSYTERVAIWAETGIASSKTVESVNKKGEKVSKTTYEPRREIVGYENVERTSYSYPFAVTIRAYDLRGGRRGIWPLWSVIARHTSGSRGMDRYLPYLLKGSQAYVGRVANTTIVVDRKDPGARLIREGEAAPPAARTAQRK